MERKLDAIEAFQQGYQEGQLAFLKLINQFCGFNAKNIQELIHAINEKGQEDVF
jgi:hypothetical protein